MQETSTMPVLVSNTLTVASNSSNTRELSAVDNEHSFS